MRLKWCVIPVQAICTGWITFRGSLWETTEYPITSCLEKKKKRYKFISISINMVKWITSYYNIVQTLVFLYQSIRFRSETQIPPCQNKFTYYSFWLYNLAMWGTKFVDQSPYPLSFVCTDTNKVMHPEVFNTLPKEPSSSSTSKINKWINKPIYFPKAP